ncbi:MAG: MXAN_6640 family putative metalloprotease [Gaiellaceae bacterium]
MAGPAVAAPGAKPLPALAPAAHDALARAVERGQLSEAEYAFERARSLFRLRAVRSAYGGVAPPDPRAATHILRDLALRLGQLSPSQRAQAKRILSRPTDFTYADEHHYEVAPAPPLCGGAAPICVHWVSSTRDAPPSTDVAGAIGPDWVETTKQVLDNVWNTEVGTFGYRAPRSDVSSPNNGGTDQLDVYLADIGGDGVPLFGYCTTDDPNAGASNPPYPFYAFSAYCVVDNDFVNFGTAHTPQEFLEVTAAHEFFHAIQFAYDAAEDLWLLEGTAAWMEDEVYPAINDNLTFLDRSAASSPGTPIDRSDGGFEYGSWLFFRYLSERLVGDRAIVREVWTRADGSEFAAFGDDYSMHGVRAALAARGKAWKSAFIRFARDNRTRQYADGFAYPVSPTARTWAIRPSRPSSRWQNPRLSHLANRFYSFKPGKGLRGRAWLRFIVDLPALKTGPAANVLIFWRTGTTSLLPIRLNRQGNGTRRVTFRRDRVTRVDLILTNSSTRYDLTTCWQGWTSYSCGGALPRDDGRVYRFRADLARP